MSNLPTLPKTPLPIPYDSEDDVFYHIFQFLPREFIRDTISLVSKLWNHYGTSNILWKYLSEVDLKIKFDIHETKSTNWRKIYFGLITSRWRWRRSTSIEDSYDEHFKAIIMGDKKVGKSSVLMRLVKRDVKKKVIKKYVSKFEMSSICTSMTDIISKETVKLQFYDTNLVDMTSYIKACRNFLTFCHAVIIVFSVDKKRTFFNAINKWLTMVQKRRLPCNVFLVANKCDLKENKRTVTTEEATVAAKTRGLHYIELSAANGRNSEDLLNSLCNVLYRRLVENQSYDSLWPDILLAQNSSKPNSIRFFHTVVSIPKRKPIDEKEYRDVYTYDSDYSSDEDQYIGFTELQMIKSNTSFDENYWEMEEETPLFSLSLQKHDWVPLDQITGSSTDENYIGSDAEEDDGIWDPLKRNVSNNAMNQSSTTNKAIKLEKKNNKTNSDLAYNTWGSSALKYDNPYRHDTDSEEEEDESDEEQAPDEDVPLSSFKDAEEYHPTFNLNSVIRESKGIKTKAVQKTFKATDNDAKKPSKPGVRKDSRIEKKNRNEKSRRWSD